MKNSFALKSSPLLAAIAVANSAFGCESPYTVTKTGDDENDPATLRGAISDMNANCAGQATQITIHESIAGATILVGEYFLSVNTNDLVTIEGPIDNPVTLESDSNGEAQFKVEGSSSLTIKNLILDGTDDLHSKQGINLTEGSGNAITIENSTFKNFGSRPLTIESGNLIIKSSRFEKTRFAAKGQYGAVLHAEDSTVSIEDSVFEGNEATGDGSRGGAIYTDTNSQLTISGSQFISNTSTDRAGAIYSLGKVAIAQSRFEKNTAQTYGGAVYLEHPSNSGTLQVDIVDTVFESNTASNNEVGQGGAVYISSSENGLTNVNIDRSFFNSNHAHYSGAAIHVADSSANKATVKISNTTISNNTALTNAGISLSGGYANGTTISHSTIINNRTTGNSGGSAIFGNGLTSGSDLEISHTIISGNTGGNGQVCNYNEANYNFSYKNSFVSDDTSSSSSCLANTADGSSQIGSDSNVLDPMLNDLADNGGASKTFYPKPNSPVINAGDSNIENAPEKDQRGNDRIMRGVIDIGAVEYGNLAPVFDTSLEDVSIEEEESIQFDVSNHISDPEGDSLIYSTSGLPAGVSIDSTSGIVSGTPTETGTFEITVTVTDDYNATSQETLTITINAKATPEPEPEPDESSNDDNDSSSGSGSLGLTMLAGLLLLFRRRK